ncbi:MAG: TIGR03960 family B12-binding radical SAM protein [Clostridia bacterium]|nr:TIGR03960 family B12-binding radical SAM protein [Clostridia bacterium]
MNEKTKALKYLKKVLKPSRYTGGELNEVIKEKTKVDARFAFCFPDTYEIGMSNLGIKILYDCLNKEDNIWCERSFAPWPDMGALMREKDISLYALESGDALKDFDFVGFTLQYELSYSNVLYMLDLAGIPLYSKDRDENCPIIIGGGPCSYNPEPVADFFDIFSIGEGEFSLVETAKLYIDYKKNHEKFDRNEFLRLASHIKGNYVPSLYDVKYEGKDGWVSSVTPKYDDVPALVEKNCLADFDNAPFPSTVPVPFTETVHDRIMLECARGCMRGCRFCQAGIIYRPYRSRGFEKLNEQAKSLYKSSGYEEMSLSSLSISDYPCLMELVDSLKEWTDREKVSLSLPSMRIDSFEAEIMKKVQGVRKTGLTFAPEAGTQRLRDVINKNLTEENILDGCRNAFSTGRTSVKLYFMNGLPTEKDEDIEGIANLGHKIVDLYYQSPDKPKGRPVEVTISVSCFVPKAHTPFQWYGQDSLEELVRKQKLLGTSIHSGKIRYNWHEAKVSRIEAVFARGDRRLSKALEIAYRNGQFFDGWDEFFSYDRWISSIEEAGLDPSFYANRKIGFDEVLPWAHIDCGVTQKFLLHEAKQAECEVTTPDCLTKCSGCGAAKFGADLCTKRKI